MAVRNGLVAIQVAVAITLLIGATLLTRSLARLTAVDPGFDANGVLSLAVNLPESRYSTGASRAAFRDELIERLRAIRGVVSVTEGSGLPSQTGFSFGGDSIGTDDGAWHVLSQTTWVTQARVDQEYFSMMGVDLVDGRPYSADDMGRDDVVIIDTHLAARLFGSVRGAVGRRLRYGRGDWREVVGITEKTQLLSPSGSPNVLGLGETQTSYEYFLPVAKEPGGYQIFGVRIRDGSAQPAMLFRQAVAAVDPMQAVSSIERVNDAYAETIAKPRFNSRLMILLSGLATVLTLIGVYGVLSFTVSSRTRELGIRLALGAPVMQVRRLVVGYGIKVTALGAVTGIAAAVPLSNSLRTLLYETPIHDVITYVVVGVLVLVAGALAAYMPSRRATKVDPATVLRAD